ncbi:uncharacterized protein LOC122062972 [Macadamia integrifolia]|uniref:uncharacterized protein LOC122062972 n=1 Tax=Macadamia integrifolia TaxID=60698 RepID=UPI001C4F89AF|nr:uncharacterized protein LOC122062972 [Macadamia integrifolia]
MNNYHILLDSQFIKRLLQPDTFFICIHSCDVLSFIVDNATIDYNRDIQLIAPLAKEKQNPVVDLCLSWISSRKGKEAASSFKRRKSATFRGRNAVPGSSSSWVRPTKEPSVDPMDFDEGLFHSLEASVAWSVFSKKSVMMEKTMVIEDFAAFQLIEKFTALGILGISAEGAHFYNPPRIKVVGLDLSLEMQESIYMTINGRKESPLSETAYTADAKVRFLVPSSPPSFAVNTHFGPIYTYVVDGAHLQPAILQSNIQIAFSKNTSRTVTFTNSFPIVHCAATLQLNINAGEKSDVGHNLLAQADTGLLPKQTISEDVEGDSDSDSDEGVGDVDHKELRRRRKIGLANKGKIPWNKGRKHSAETRTLIKQKTIEDLSDPKVKKMSEYPHAHTTQSKARIGYAQRQVWAKRLKWKRHGEKLYLKWAKSIAEAARRGGNNQHELKWDSFDKIKVELAVKQLQWAADKEREKELAKMRRENAAEAKAEKMARITLKRKKKGKMFPLHVGPQIHRRKSKNSQVGSQEDTTTGYRPAIEKWDPKFIQREKLRKKISLADQIEAARSRRAEYAAQKSLAESRSHPSIAWSMGEEKS